MQSYAEENIAVGFQRKYEGIWSAFYSIYSENGVRGLYRNVSGNIPRSILASGAQLATFEPAKDFMHRHKLSFDNSTLNSFIAALIAGTAMSIAMAPPDIILTRLYNQPVDDTGRGQYYNGVIDCICKTTKYEGIAGLSKGFWPIYFRIAPHSTIVLLMFDQAK